MRSVIQRVRRAAVEVHGAKIASIGNGLAALVGFDREDGPPDMEYIAGKILGLRIFDDGQGVMNLSLQEAGGELLLISQFTLYGDARKGRRPSYSSAMTPDRAAVMYTEFVALCKSLYPKVESGEFGAHMEVDLVNSGPVTILLDSRKQF